MLVFALMVACTAGKDSGDQGVTTVDPLEWSVFSDGGFSVGHRLVEQTYIDPAGETVVVPINIWYPTEQTDGPSPVYYSIQEDELAISDATPAAPVHDGGFPVMLFSHGSHLYGGSSSYLMRHFASHGWVVAAPDHIGNTLVDYGDGVSLPVFYHRPLNDRAALTAVAAQTDLAAVTDAVMMSGYSFGGYDAWVLNGAPLNRAAFAKECESGVFEGCTDAQLDALDSDLSMPEVVGVMPLAGAGHFHHFASGGLANRPAPALMMSGSEDDDDPQQMWTETAGTPMIWATVEGGCHALFSVGGCAEIETEEGYAIIEALALAFARQTLLRDDSEAVTALLSGADVPWETVSIQSRD